jgi:hypothetical protein
MLSGRQIKLRRIAASVEQVSTERTFLLRRQMSAIGTCRHLRRRNNSVALGEKAAALFH